MFHWNELLIYDIQELHDAEMRLLDFWPQMSEKAAAPALKEAFELLYGATERQIERLEQMAQLLGVAPDEVSSKGMKGLITEAGTVLDAQGDPRVLDLALVGASRKVEHYGLAAYYTARALAQRMDLRALADLLASSLEEMVAIHDGVAAATEGRHLPAALHGVAGG